MTKDQPSRDQHLEAETAAGTALVAATTSLTRSPAATVPEWLERGVLTAPQFCLPDRIPAGAAHDLRAAAARHRADLAILTTKDDRDEILGELRLSTIARNESREEAVGRFKLLRRAVEDVPLQILRDACTEYARRVKFFPGAVAELLVFTNAALRERLTMAFRLDRIADAAAEQDAERERLESDPLTPEAMAAIKAEFQLDRDPIEVVVASKVSNKAVERFVAQPDDYVRVGMNETQAAAASAERERILKRQPKIPTEADYEALKASMEPRPAAPDLAAEEAEQIALIRRVNGLSEPASLEDLELDDEARRAA